MARGPDGSGGGAGFSLSDQLFNAQTLGDLAQEYAVLPGFDADLFEAKALAGLPGRTLLDRLEHIADCIEEQLPSAFPDMADALEAAMPPPLDPGLSDDDFGRFIHAVPGILAARHGLDDHRDRALDLLHAATQRFSMEFYIRFFLDRWPDETFDRLEAWTQDPNYHVRRLVSEGTRPKLPWAKALSTPPDRPLALLDLLHTDPTRYVTRSVANHINDLTKMLPDHAYARLRQWQSDGQQAPKELDWMTRHALRSAVKAGAPEALEILGYVPDPSLRLEAFEIAQTTLARGEPLVFSATLGADKPLPVMVDYVIHFVKAGGHTAPKTFKLKAAELGPGKPLTLSKIHKLKWDATTFRLHPGVHRLQMQVNGVVLGDLSFELRG